MRNKLLFILLFSVFISRDYVDCFSDENKTTSAQKKSKSELSITQIKISWGYKETSPNREINTIIIHSMYNPLVADSFGIESIILVLKKYKVAAHFVIGRDGIIYQLVDVKYSAYHAGVSRMPDGRTQVNRFSIGIEVVNSIHTSPTEAQYYSLSQLIKSLRLKYKISSILGHNQIAPNRKTDPWNFDWNKFRDMIQ